MVEKKNTSAKASIGRGSHDNIVIQNAEFHNLVVVDNSTSLIKVFGGMGRFDLIQEQVLKSLSDASQSHPLYPYFGVRPNYELSRLVSSPETEDAFKKYPKVIKGTFRIDYSQYPNMDKSETIWEYGYRTQTSITLDTTAFQEYLGEVVDPFPVTNYVDGMTTTISPPEFPPALEATIVSGEICIPIFIRRKPSMNYGETIIGTISNEHGFELRITTSVDVKKNEITISKVSGCELDVQLQREKLINSLKVSKQMKIMIGSSTFWNAVFDEENLKLEMFRNAPQVISYLESLLIIEKHTACKFDNTREGFSYDDYKTALILASSLEGKWHPFRTDFDNESHCDHDGFPDNMDELIEDCSEFRVDRNVLGISFHGLEFIADKYQVVYSDVIINNFKSVVKNIKKKKKNIMITFRPADGKESFLKYCRFEGVRIITQKKL